MIRRERRQTSQRFQPLPLGGDRSATPPLVGGDDDVDETLEEIPLLGGASPPCLLELLVCLEPPAHAAEQ
jgi:hypothetical protein